MGALPQAIIGRRTVTEGHTGTRSPVKRLILQYFEGLGELVLIKGTLQKVRPEVTKAQ